MRIVYNEFSNDKGLGVANKKSGICIVDVLILYSALGGDHNKDSAPVWIVLPAEFVIISPRNCSADFANHNIVYI